MIYRNGRVVMIDFGRTKQVSSPSVDMKDCRYFRDRWLPYFISQLVSPNEYNEIKAVCDGVIANTTTAQSHPFAVIYAACWRLHVRVASIKPVIRTIMLERVTSNVLKIVEAKESVTEPHVQDASLICRTIRSVIYGICSTFFAFTSNICQLFK
jgi:hypothetical protein